MICQCESFSIHIKVAGPRERSEGTPSISEPKLLLPALFCLLISCPPECAPIVEFRFRELR